MYKDINDHLDSMDFIIVSYINLVLSEYLLKKWIEGPSSMK